MKDDVLSTPIEYLKGVGPKRADLLKKELEIFTFEDLLHHYPFRYVDRSKFYRVAEIHEDMPHVQLIGKIVAIRKLGNKGGSRLVAKFQDDSGQIELVWFKGVKWIADSLQPNEPYVLFGKPTKYKSSFNIVHPEMELQKNHQQSINSQLQAVYHSTEKLNNRGLGSRAIWKLQRILLGQLNGNIPETVSKKLVEDYQLLTRNEALMHVHFPGSSEILAKAIFRLKFEELLYIQLKLIRQKLVNSTKLGGFNFANVGDYFNRFYAEKLPFELTNAQKKVLKEIRKDVNGDRQMNRLLQGDVGSGKTVVATMCMLMALDNGFQACLMAPTEILANQHFESIGQMLEGLGIVVGLLTGSTKTAQRKTLHEQLENGQMQILIGTHALIEDKVQFKNLGLVVIDEQHRFGVAQRAKLWKKNSKPPHIMVMTATPIPRTLGMTLYGDLDVSVIDELPPGRKPIKTIHRRDSARLKVFGFMEQEIKKGRQVYVVYPLIKESEKLDYKDLMDGYESITRRFPAPDHHVSIVHGQMKAADKDFEMERFVKGQTQIMVATTVIEVGVNVPNASVMVIESAERFGLSQLHQLRGRVGRGAEQSYCVLMTGNKLTSDSKVRMETMVNSTDGFEIAEVDLKLRGPGDFYGTQQSGVPIDLKLTNLAKDGQIVQVARDAAQTILKSDPELEQPEHALIRKEFIRKNARKVNWSRIS